MYVVSVTGSCRGSCCHGKLVWLRIWWRDNLKCLTTLYRLVPKKYVWGWVSFNSHLKTFSVVHSDRPKRAMLKQLERWNTTVHVVCQRDVKTWLKRLNFSFSRSECLSLHLLLRVWLRSLSETVIVYCLVLNCFRRWKYFAFIFSDLFPDWFVIILVRLHLPIFEGKYLQS